MKFFLQKSKEILHEFFQISVLLKGVHGIVELLGGALVFVVSDRMLEHAIAFMTEGELIEDRHDFLANMLVTGAEHLMAGRTFAVLYLLTHGAINLSLALGLWKKKMWAYPAAIAALAVFTGYQTYRLTIHASSWLLILTVFDIVMIGLTYYEFLEKRNSTRVKDR